MKARVEAAVASRRPHRIPDRKSQEARLGRIDEIERRELAVEQGAAAELEAGPDTVCIFSTVAQSPRKDKLCRERFLLLDDMAAVAAVEYQWLAITCQSRERSTEAYVRKDRARIEALLAKDFHFTSPLDNRLDRSILRTVLAQ